MKPISGDSARLLNISRSGVLLETTARLQPGRRSTVVIVNDEDKKEKAEGQVIRTELVSIGKSGELIYRTAMAFTAEFDLRLPEAVPDADQEHQVCVQSQLDGPIDAVWATATGSKPVKATHITPTCCYIEAAGEGTQDEWASVTLYFSPVRSLTLQGKVAAVEPERGCLLRFEKLSPEIRRALRVEIREGIAHGAAAPPQPMALGTVVGSDSKNNVVFEWHAHTGALHANQW